MATTGAPDQQDIIEFGQTERKLVKAGNENPFSITRLIYKQQKTAMQETATPDTKEIKDRLTVENLKPDTIPTSCAMIVLVFGTLAACLIIVLNVVFELPLFIQGINFIYAYQSLQPWVAIRVIQNIFSLFCNPIGVGVALGLYYIIVNRKLLILVHVSYFLFATYIIAILKQAIQQSRPIWYDSRIQNWEWFCPKDFGNPSGHSFAVILLYEPMFSDSIGYWKYRPWAIILVIFCIMVPVSRMYLGVHSANQILFGLSLGTTFLILYKYIYQRALYQLAWQFLTSSKQKLKLLLVILLNLVVIAVPIIFYYVNKAQRPMLEKDIINLNKQCGTKLTGEQVQEHMLTACAIGCFAFGLIYGFILLMNASGYRKYLLGLWEYETKLKILLKIVVYIVCAGIPFLIFFLIAQFAVKSSAIGDYFLMCAAIMGAGLGLSFFAPVLTAKWKIMKLLPGSAEDYGKKIDQIH